MIRTIFLKNGGPKMEGIVYYNSASRVAMVVAYHQIIHTLEEGSVQVLVNRMSTHELMWDELD